MVDILGERKKALKGIATDTVINYLLYNQNFSESQKREILSIARKLNPVRVDWDTFRLAIRKWRENSQK